MKIKSTTQMEKQEIMKITLRPYQLCDIDHFMAWACDQEVLQLSSLQWHVSYNSSRQDIVSYFSQVIIPHPWYRAICLNSRPIGFICLIPGSETCNKCRAGLSYALGREYWGRGITSSATRMAIEIAFKEIPGLLRIEAFVATESKDSQRVLEKAGFLKEGLLRKYFTPPNGTALDVIVYSIVSSDLN